MSYVRQSPASPAWFRYDDDKVTEVATADILKLKGGGDWDMAYLCIYRMKE
jgi:ubiquitin carboxyl-terminal hydrolase 14